MLLDRIDIDEHGPLNRVELGPLSEQLNVVFAPVGSGKTAIARFIRDTLVDRQYPTGMLSSSTGRVVWATRSGLVHCHREQDGTRQGRRRVHVESRGELEPHYEALQSCWLDSIATSSAAHRSLDAIELPESIVDGVITDTAVTNVARVVAACLRHGLDRHETFQHLPLSESNLESVDAEQRQQLRAELAGVESELARLGELGRDHQSLVARRNSLSAKLATWYRDDHAPNGYDHRNYDDLHRRSNQLHAQARQLRSRQSELRSYITDLERQIDERRVSSAGAAGLDDHLIRLRRSLMNVTTDLDQCLSEAAEVRRSMRWTDGRHHWIDRDGVVAELRRIDDALVASSRRHWLQSRRNRLRQQLDHSATTTTPTTASALTSIASQWLVRLSGGRLNRIDWSSHELVRGKDQHCHRVSVHLNGRPESEFALPDRALAALAVRMAAGQLLARIGRHVPLVVETQREMWQTQQTFVKPDATAYFQPGEHHRSNHPLVAAMHDYAAGGRQLLVLTSDRHLLGELNRAGARSFEIHGQRTVHAHRPLWRSYYEPEHYVGPHTHLHGSHEVETVRYPAADVVTSVDDVNRDFDLAWHQSQQPNHVPHATGSSRSSYHVASDDTVVPEVTDHAAAGVLHRDGYYYADTFTTVARPVKQTTAACEQCGSSKKTSAITTTKRRSPFLLSVDSPIDQAPSIDAVAAARLRGLKVTHVTHLMQQDPNRLSDALGMASVDAETVRQWQAESRLCCRVPQLRNFDARILVGCGITTPAQLAAIHPNDLLHEVESFLATEDGQRILRSGSSQELSRITTWIATANSGAGEGVTLNGEVVRRGRHSSSSRRSSSSSRSRLNGVERSRVERDSDADSDSEFEGRSRSTRSRSSSRRTSRSRSDSSRSDSSSRSGSRSSSRSSRRSNSRSSSRRSGSGTGRSRRGESNRSRTRRGVRVERDRYSSDYQRQPRESVRYVADEQEVMENQGESNDVVQYESRSESRSWKFYLERESPVVDAPSIGSRMAERLNEAGVYTVDDLLNSDPESLAEELDHRRVDADTVLQWQQQATLVCRIPMLRGHDAQLLVAAEITTPEELAASDAEELFGLVDPISRSSEGKRIIRGGKRPDLEEVTDWIEYAQHTRELKAA